MIRGLARLVLTALIALNGGAAAWVLARHPFVEPVVARSAHEARLAIEAAMAGTVTADWLLPRFAQALEAADLDRLEMYAGLAETYRIALPPDQVARAAALKAERETAWAQARDCGACAWDIADCATLAMIGACALPVEVTPLGDLNALRRAGVAAATGAEVDEVEAGLAVVGLVASGAVLVTGGTSATAKLGATALRVGRRIGAVGEPLLRVLADAARGLIRWDRLGSAVLSRSFGEAVDGARYARLSAMAADLGRVWERTSATEAVVLLRHVDDAPDLARLARVTEVAGKDSRRVFEVLGKARTFRLLDRISTLAALAIGLVATLLASLTSLALGLTLRRLRAAIGR